MLRTADAGLCSNCYWQGISVVMFPTWLPFVKVFFFSFSPGHHFCILQLICADKKHCIEPIKLLLGWEIITKCQKLKVINSFVLAVCCFGFQPPVASARLSAGPPSAAPLPINELWDSVLWALVTAEEGKTSMHFQQSECKSCLWSVCPSISSPLSLSVPSWE